MFPCSHGKIFCWDGSGKFKNTRRKGTDQENSKKQEGKNGGKKKKRFLCMWRFSCVFHRSGTPWEYRPHATLPQENPLIWEPPLQQNSLSTQGSKLECVEGSGREITVCYSPPKLVQLSWAPALCS